MSVSNTPRHFLDLSDFEPATLRALIGWAKKRKRARTDLPRGEPDIDRPLAGKLLALLFEKQSTRTRISFDVAMRQLGGQTMVLNGYDLQLGHGETVADTARVLSRYVDAIVLRTADHRKLVELAENASVPVINGLTDKTHPCQALSDVFTFEERLGSITNRLIAWSGSYSNVAASWIQAAALLGFGFRIATPADMAPPPVLLEWARQRGAEIRLLADPLKAVSDADCVMTDTWVSITEEESIGKDAVAERFRKLAPYQVTEQLMRRAAQHAIFLHCLPAHREEEVTSGVIDGPQSAVFDGAENRLHVQKAILEWCLGSTKFRGRDNF